LNSDAPWPDRVTARARVLDHQRKLHRWSRAEPARRFGDLFNLVCDRATLVVAWERVAGNRGARTAGVDAVTRLAVERRGVPEFLDDLRVSLKDGTFAAVPVLQVTIPKKGGKVRALGIPTLRDRVAQMALKLILEPIFEAPRTAGPHPHAPHPHASRKIHPAALAQAIAAATTRAARRLVIHLPRRWA